MAGRGVDIHSGTSNSVTVKEIQLGPSQETVKSFIGVKWSVSKGQKLCYFVNDYFLFQERARQSFMRVKGTVTMKRPVVAYRVHWRWRRTRTSPPWARGWRAARPSSSRTAAGTGQAWWRNHGSASAWRRIGRLGEETQVREVQQHPKVSFFSKLCGKHCVCLSRECLLRLRAWKCKLAYKKTYRPPG